MSPSPLGRKDKYNYLGVKKL
ncbi:43bb1374-7d1b-40a6-9376-d0f439a95839 [Thermothielavioides terrestris]|uniref:43bb1374-7d1b-40a6-9376-d0f439a95839 n=1 Tax=Thermothielavioides terrestris TaxID=2587410 RepID=A0A3S4AYJ3_9PEZI|nr:43bb1374-7d1b-40a6-9376-d0f439a95839 [Thermothielavioides terrestris]